MAVGGTWVEAEGSISNFQNWKKNGREWRWAKSASSVYSQRSGGTVARREGRSLLIGEVLVLHL